MRQWASPIPVSQLSSLCNAPSLRTPSSSFAKRFTKNWRPAPWTPRYLKDVARWIPKSAATPEARPLSTAAIAAGRWPCTSSSQMSCPTQGLRVDDMMPRDQVRGTPTSPPVVTPATTSGYRRTLIRNFGWNFSNGLGISPPFCGAGDAADRLRTRRDLLGLESTTSWHQTDYCAFRQSDQDKARPR